MIRIVAMPADLETTPESEIRSTQCREELRGWIYMSEHVVNTHLPLEKLDILFTFGWP